MDDYLKDHIRFLKFVKGVDSIDANRLAKAAEAQKYFDAAENFYRASQTIYYNLNKEGSEEKELGMINVFNVNHSFAIELYLKCLICIEKGEVKGKNRNHLLFKLYSVLSTSTQERIKHLYNESSLKLQHATVFLVNPNEDDFVEILKEIDTPFEIFRYYFEKGVELPIYKLNNAVSCIRAVIFEVEELIHQKYAALF
ncbi:hypothetical protein GALL_172830 [mine drainage metagenome]|uniref:HEPN domain-containing protein n=1 Tax=mine drainage metagenome TaxID=410659 RepID=A0A1J5RWS0_9ZZZZ